MAAMQDGAVREERHWLGRVGWPETILLVLLVLVVRIIWLVAVSSWELVADEAHYWEWSRRLDLSYYSKGPGVALLIAASTGLFGASEWAVRLPAAISSAVGALVLARLTIDISGDERAGFLAAGAFFLLPILQLQAQVMTIDPPFMAAWALAAWAGWHAFSAHAGGRRPWLMWALLGLAMGAAFLTKYVIVLLAPGLLLYALLRCRELPWDRRLTIGILVAIIAFVAAISPWIVWNAEHGWPAIRHELGHLGAPGGDVPPQWDEPHGIPSMLELLASQVGVFGPPAFVLMVMATVRAIRRRGEEPRRWPAHLYLLSVGLPTIAFFLAVSLVTGVEANWPAPGYLTLLVLVAAYSAEEWLGWLRRLREWEAGGVARKPRSGWVVGWRWMIGLGLVTTSILWFPHTWERVPGLGELMPMQRIEGARERAALVEGLRDELRERTGAEPLVIGGSYGEASLLAFYLPDRPIVYSADQWVRRRESQYDYWEETDLTAPALHGRPAVMVRQPAENWREAFAFEGFETVRETPPPVHVAEQFRGLAQYAQSPSS